MFNFFKIFVVAIMALFIGACEDVGTYELDDTGDTKTTGWAEYTANVTYPGGEVADTGLTVFASTSTSIYDTFAGDVMSLPAPDNYVVRIGSPTETSSDGLPIIIDTGDIRWIYPEIELDVTDGDDIEDNIVLNKYVNIPDCVCHLVGYDGWEYDYVDGDVENIDGYKLEFDQSIGSTSWIEIQGNELILAGKKAEDGAFLTEYLFTEDSLSFKQDNGSGLIDSFTCRSQ